MFSIFCQSPIDRKQPDEMFQAEAAAATAVEMCSRLIDFEALVNDNDIEKCLKAIAPNHDEDAVYRGWMMSPDKYSQLFKGLSARGIRLINNPEQYTYCHYLPEWLSAVGDKTPQTTVIPLKSESELTMEKLSGALAPFGVGAVIVKDYVKSEKHHWKEACFIPDASNIQHALQVSRRFLELRGSDLEGGLVFRKYLKFKEIGVHPRSGMPLTEEYRAFVLYGRLMCLLNYWDEVEYPASNESCEEILNAVSSIPSNFFTVDFARLDDGTTMIIELGDGQVSGLPENADLKQFFDSLQHATLPL